MSSIPAFSYDRVSTEEQAKGQSMAAQFDRAGDYAQRNGLEIIERFSAAESAWKEGRKEFNRMIDKALESGVKDLIFKNTDRMARNGVDWIRLKKLAKEGKINIHLYELNKVFDANSTAEDEMFLDNTASFAAYWSNKISQGVRAAYKYKASIGSPPAPYPIGYKYDKKDKRHYPDPDSFDMIDFIHTEYDNNNISYRELTQRVNDRGYRTKRGSKWKASSIYNILKNPFYCGRWTYRGESHIGEHYQYISYDRYLKRLERMSLKFTGKKSRVFDFPFANMLFIDRYKLTGEMKKEKHIYYTNRLLGASYRQDRIERLIAREIEKIRFTAESADYLKNAFRSAYNAYTASAGARQGSISRDIIKRENSIQKLLDLFIDDEIDKKYLKEKIKTLREEILRLSEERELLQSDKLDVVDNIAEIIDTIKSLPEIYRQASIDDKAKILKKIASRIVIHDDTVDIKYVEPFSLIVEVRKYPDMHARLDDFRTVLTNTYIQFVRYYAAA